MTTPSSEAARAEAERRYPLFDNELTDFSTARRAAFIAGAEWKGVQVEEELLSDLAKALEYRMSWIHDSGHIPKFGDDWLACSHQRCVETRALMERTLQEEGSE
jgi:hypothetical protein